MASNRELFARLEAKYRLPGGFLARTYQLESGSGAKLYNKGSGAEGHFQFMPSTARRMDLADPYDLEASADATARLAVQNREYLQRRGIENPDGKVLYLAHQQGAAGAETLLKAGNTPAASALGEVYKNPKVAAKAVSGNGGEPDMPASAFAGRIMAKYEGKDASTPLRPYSALGETAPIDQMNTADVLEGAAPPEEGGDSRQQSAALGTFLNASNALQQQPQAPLLPIPRLSYADGGEVSSIQDVYPLFDPRTNS